MPKVGPAPPQDFSCHPCLTVLVSCKRTLLVCGPLTATAAGAAPKYGVASTNVAGGSRFQQQRSRASVAGCFGDSTNCNSILLFVLVIQLWLTDVEIFATVIAALVHDYEHNGTTNTFHVNTGYLVPAAIISEMSTLGIETIVNRGKGMGTRYSSDPIKGLGSL